MVRLPQEFISWNYKARRSLIKNLRSGGHFDPYRLQLEFTRHNPVLCTAAPREDGTMEVNGKVIGIGYVLKKEYLSEAVARLEDHVRTTDEELAANPEDKDRILARHADRGVDLLLDLLYLPDDVADERVDFQKLASLELALRIPHSSKHTWSIVQRSGKASLVFYQPPATSFEVRCSVSIHENDIYHRFVSLVHDTFHYTPPEARARRPAYLFHVEEVYNNSASPAGFGRRLA
ncbi:MAG: hypothetical protein ABWK01_02055 [Infirmifilum sp.]